MGIGPYTISKEAIAKIHAQRKKNKEEGIDFRLPKHIFTEERYIPECIVPDFYKIPEYHPRHIPDLTIERIHTDGIKELSTAIWSHSISFMARDLHLLRKSYWEKEPFKNFAPIVRAPIIRAVPFDYTFNLTGHQGVVFRWENYLFDKRVIRSNYGFLVPRVPFGPVKSVHSFLPSTHYLWYINDFNASFFSRNSKINIISYDYIYRKRLLYRSRYQYKFKRQYFRWWRLERWIRSSHFNRDFKLDNFSYNPFHFLYFIQAKCLRNFLLMCYFGEDLNLERRMEDIIKWLTLSFSKIYIYFIKLIILILIKISLIIEKSSIFWLLLYEFLLHAYVGYVLHTSYFANMLYLLVHTNFLVLFWSIFVSIIIQPIVYNELFFDCSLLILLGNFYLLSSHFLTMMYQSWMLVVSFMHIGLLENISMSLHTWNYLNAFFNIKFIAQQTLPYTTKAIILDLKTFYDLHNDILLDILFPKSNPDKLVRVKQLGALIYDLIYFVSEKLTPYKKELIPLIRAQEMAMFRSVDLETVEYILILNYLQLEKYYDYQRKQEYNISIEVEEIDKWYKEVQLEKTKERIFATLRDIERLKRVQAEKIEELLDAGEVVYGISRDPFYEVSFVDNFNIISITHENIEESNYIISEINDYSEENNYEIISELNREFVESNYDPIPSDNYDRFMLSDRFSSIIPDGTILSNIFTSIIPDGTILSNIFTVIIDAERILFTFYVNLNAEYLINFVYLMYENILFNYF